MKGASGLLGISWYSSREAEVELTLEISHLETALHSRWASATCYGNQDHLVPSFLHTRDRLADWNHLFAFQENYWLPVKLGDWFAWD